MSAEKEELANRLQQFQEKFNIDTVEQGTRELLEAATDELQQQINELTLQKQQLDADLDEKSVREVELLERLNELQEELAKALESDNKDDDMTKQLELGKQAEKDWIRERETLQNQLYERLMEISQLKVCWIVIVPLCSVIHVLLCIFQEELDRTKHGVESKQSSSFDDIKTELEEKNKDIELLMEQLHTFKAAYDEKEDEYKLVSEQMDEMKSMVEEQQKLLEDQHAKLSEQDTIISQKEIQLKQFGELLDQLKDEDNGKVKLEETLLQTRTTQSELEKNIDNLNNLLKTKDNEIDILKAETERHKDDIEQYVGSQESLSNEVRYYHEIKAIYGF